MTRVLTPTDRDRLKAEAEEQRCRNVIESCGWRVTHVTRRYNGPHYTIVDKRETYKFGHPEDLAQQVARGKKRQQQETTMSDVNADRFDNEKREGSGYGAKTGSMKGGGDSRSPLEKRGGTKLETGGSKGGK